YDLFDDGQEWLKRKEYRKLATPRYWNGKARGIPALTKKIAQAPRVFSSAASDAASLIKKQKRGEPPRKK
ncbi:MAG TPA: hypothetical protein PKV09_11255, partial [Syntrophales bacterium]|nr:hypothetical protein [Syntrophales bacterium]